MSKVVDEIRIVEGIGSPGEEFSLIGELVYPAGRLTALWIKKTDPLRSDCCPITAISVTSNPEPPLEDSAKFEDPSFEDFGSIAPADSLAGGEETEFSVIPVNLTQSPETPLFVQVARENDTPIADIVLCEDLNSAPPDYKVVRVNLLESVGRSSYLAFRKVFQRCVGVRTKT